MTNCATEIEILRVLTDGATKLDSSGALADGAIISSSVSDTYAMRRGLRQQLREGKNMRERIETIISEKVNPMLESHKGGVELSSYENNIAYIKMTGACSECPSAQYTLEEVVKEIIMKELPDLEDVVLDTSVSQDLIDMAKKLLNGEK
ncbi:hypothetical protein FACS1894127_1010 [Clostridia bacterium]|nr:hypothetical protein FACS1894127_1010 [Clostridia bacterium]